MNALTKITLRNIFTLLGVVALAVAACGTAPKPTAVALSPTKAPLSQPTKAPVQPTAKPPQPTAVKPTEKPKPTSKPATAPTQPPQPTAVPTQQAKPTTPASPLGKEQTIGNLSVVATKLDDLAQSGQDKPKAGDVYKVVSVVIENMSKTETLSFDPAKFVMVDPTGATFSMSILKSLTGELKSQSLKPGEKLQGKIVYEVPAEIQKLNLEFHGANNQNATWSLAG